MIVLTFYIPPFFLSFSFLLLFLVEPGVEVRYVVAAVLGGVSD